MNQNNPNIPGGEFGQGSPNPTNPYGGYPQVPNPNFPQQPGFPPGQPQGFPPMGQSPAGKNISKDQKNKAPKRKKPKKPSNAGWVWLGILVMLVITAGGAILGYNTAIRERESAFEKMSVQAASEQYQYALTDIINGKLENAKTRLEYVLSVDPNYPGATEKYTELVIQLFPKETPTPFYTPTPAPTSTPDTRGEEDMFNTILSSMAASEWEIAIQNMDALRDKNLEFRSMEIDGLYYIALRNWGINLINQGYLESGIYKITLAEAFGPIDSMANNQRLAARSFLAGAGFWEIKWDKALEYYRNAYLTAPNMYDRATGKTAQQRYAEASFEYANQLVANYENQLISESELCEAIIYYDQGYSIGANDMVAPTATAVYLVCNPPAATSAPDVSSDIAPTMPLELPTETPFIEPTPPGQ